MESGALLTSLLLATVLPFARSYPQVRKFFRFPPPASFFKVFSRDTPRAVLIERFDKYASELLSKSLGLCCNNTLCR